MGQIQPFWQTLNLFQTHFLVLESWMEYNIFGLEKMHMLKTIYMLNLKICCPGNVQMSMTEKEYR